MPRHRIIISLLLCAVPLTARAEPEKPEKAWPGGKAPSKPPTTRKPEPPKKKKPKKKKKKKKPILPTPIGAYTLAHTKVGVLVELGYPFFVFQLGYGLGSRAHLIFGYRGMYTLTSAAFGGFKVRLYSDKPKNIGIALKVLGGWTDVRKDKLGWAMLVGSGGAFGEVWLTSTSRKGRHGAMVNIGLRLSQVESCDPDEENCYDHPFRPGGKKGVLATAFAEIGYELRFGVHSCYFVAIGADMFANSRAMPSMVRIRNGIMWHF